LWCWGENGFGKLGNNTIITVSTPTQESTAASNWDRVSAGLHHTCATKTTGTLWCWGVNGLGQLGDGTTTNRLSPSQESSAATNWTAVSAAQAHSCGVKITGTLWCWGFNLFGQLGTGPNGRALPEPVHLE
jgi:alpha-tubulin suppressor-like RCC1 family protein